MSRKLKGKWLLSILFLLAIFGGYKLCKDNKETIHDLHNKADRKVGKIIKAIKD